MEEGRGDGRGPPEEVKGGGKVRGEEGRRGRGGVEMRVDYVMRLLLFCVKQDFQIELLVEHSKEILYIMNILFGETDLLSHSPTIRSCAFALSSFFAPFAKFKEILETEKEKTLAVIEYVNQNVKRLQMREEENEKKQVKEAPSFEKVEQLISSLKLLEYFSFSPQASSSIFSLSSPLSSPQVEHSKVVLKMNEHDFPSTLAASFYFILLSLSSKPVSFPFFLKFFFPSFPHFLFLLHSFLSPLSLFFYSPF